MMKFRTCTLMIVFIVLLGLGISTHGAAFSANVPASTPPLRVSEPVAVIVADLEKFIPTSMNQGGIPGVAVALIRDNKVVWSEGFGVVNILTREPVTEDTVFEVASNSKVVSAYATLRLVEQGLLSLDEPVDTYLSEPWLPPQTDGGDITLRQLASHSSGLTDNLIPMDKDIIFKPGSDFRYSGVGFLYLQEVLEQVSSQSLDEILKTEVFEPLGMTSSDLVIRAEIRPYLANGHMDTILPVLAFTVPFGLIFVVLGLVGLLILRISSGKWQPTRKMVVGTALLAGLLTLLAFILLIGKDLPNLVLLIAIVGVIFALFLVVMGWVARLLCSHLPAALQGRKTKRFLGLIWFGLGIFLFMGLSGRMTGPLPAFLSPQPSAVGSMRTSVKDLATFLVEIAEPQHLKPELAAQLRAPQVTAGKGMSWGLGPGIKHGEYGDALWQNGQTFGFRSLMMIYPEQQIGVVVLTNSEDGFPLACEIAQRALGSSELSGILAWLQ